MIEFKDPEVPIKAEVTPQLQSWFDELGQTYRAAPLPKDIERGPVGHCFDACLFNLMFHRKYTYVEGLARSRAAGKDWTVHAWLTDGVHAFDPTWRAYKGGKEITTLPVDYIGIPLPAAAVAMFNHHTGRSGVLPNYNKWTQLVDRLITDRRRELKGVTSG